jgi:hypothetical protein
MSLGKLLATGRSLVSGPSLGRYDISPRNRLPKFGSAKNPFAQPAQPAPTAASPLPAPEVEQAPTEPLITPVASPVEPKKTQVLEYKKTQRIPALADQRAGPGWVARLKQWGLAALAMCGAVWTNVRAWAGKLYGSVVARVRRPQRKPVIPALGRPSAVQTELSLDNVKVVRNDLEESDLEIVTSETATSTQVAPTAPVAQPRRGPVPPALKKLTDHLIGVKST